MHDDQELSGLLPFSKDACMDVGYTIATQPHECNAMTDTPNLKDDCLKPIDIGGLSPSTHSQHPPRILILYGSLRDRSFPALRRKRVGGFWNDLGQRCGFSALPGYRLSMMALMQATRKLQSFGSS